MTLSSLSLPPCPHYAECGGCQFQELDAESYRRKKEEDVKALLLHGGIFPRLWKPPVFIPSGTRRRVTFAAVKENGAVRVGFTRLRSHQLVPVSRCLLLLPSLQRILERLPEALLPVLHEKAPVDVFFQDVGGSLDCVLIGLPETGARQNQDLARFADFLGLSRVSLAKRLGAPPRVLVELSRVCKVSGKLSVSLPPLAFLQPSAEGEDALCQAVLDGLSSLKGRRGKILDLFSGCGTFAGRLLDKASVHAVESDLAMVSALGAAARGHPLLTTEQRDLFKEPFSSRELSGVSAVVLDPPRAGAKEQAEKLARSTVPLVVYVSCSPPSFVRDARLLVSGGYQVESLQMVDQFTWSSHVELVAFFRHKTASRAFIEK